MQLEGEKPPGDNGGYFNPPVLLCTRDRKAATHSKVASVCVCVWREINSFFLPIISTSDRIRAALKWRGIRARNLNSFIYPARIRESLSREFVIIILQRFLIKLRYFTFPFPHAY